MTTPLNQAPINQEGFWLIRANIRLGGEHRFLYLKLSGARPRRLVWDSQMFSRPVFRQNAESLLGDLIAVLRRNGLALYSPEADRFILDSFNFENPDFIESLTLEVVHLFPGVGRSINVKITKEQ
jgi:hypothetical protein